MATYAENGYDEHFAFTPQEDCSRASRLGTRSGRGSSPTHSAHASLIRHSILKSSDEKKAKKVRFYRNGDRFFKGMVYAVSPERFRTFESLLAELTASPICDKKVLPNGVRHVFSVDGMKKITNLDQLREGESYVCATFEMFKDVDYARSSNPTWNVNVKSRESESPFSASKDMSFDDHKDFIKPKLVTVIRNGSKPRKAVRVLLNKKTAHSFDQVLDDVTEAIKLDSGNVRKIFTLDGRQVTCLYDFFKDDSIFIAYGPEKYSMDDFDLDENEVKLVSAYKASNPKPERVTLRSPRRLSSSSKSLNEVGLDSPRSPLSPRSPRKLRTISAPKYRLKNGINGDYHEGPPALAKKYEIGKVIGEGNFAVVKECSDRKSKKKYALKIIDKERCKGKEQMIENEVSILRKVKHPNVILLVEEYDTQDELYLVMELVKGGDLFDAIALATKYTERDACSMVFNLSSALKYLHSLNIVHRDVKPENLLVCEHSDGSKSLKLGDFGLATYATEDLYTVCGTPTYVAPEILAETGYGQKVDIWAAGVITYILLCGFPPFVSQTHDQEDLFDKILEGELEFLAPYWDEVSESAKELITQMLDVDPTTRFTADEILTHPWVADDTAKDYDLHDYIAKELRMHFARKKRPSMNQAGIRLVACTALDKTSRYFEGRKGAQLTLQPNGKTEVF